MSLLRKCDVLIAGAGPAGLATALYLLREHPELRGRVVAIERSRHPRLKTCAGGLIPKTMLALSELGLALEVPAIEVTRGTARSEAGVVEMDRGDTLCTIVRRDQFDARLARAALAAGLEMVEDCRVLEAEQGAVGSECAPSAPPSRRRSWWVRMAPGAGCAMPCSAAARKLSGAR